MSVMEETRDSIIAGFPTINDDDEGEPADLSAPTAETTETPTATTETTETPTAEVTTEETPAYTPEQVKEYQEQAKNWNAFNDHLQSLPPEQRQAALVAMGLAEETPPLLQDPADLRSPFEEAMAPHLESLVGMPQRFDAFENELQQTFAAQSHVLDHTAVNAEVGMAVLEHLAEQFQLEMPKIDAKTVLDAVRQGKDLKSFIREAMKPTFEKNKARMAQARAPRPETIGDDANDALTGIEDSDDMSDILLKARGRRS